LAPIAEAIRKIHFPATPEEAAFARRRFVYQELLLLQLALAICRARRRINMRAPALPRNGKIDARIRSLFPFELTEAQNAAIAEISADMGRPVPTNRLLQGDVGSGKTVVAIYAMLQAVANGAQAVLMAPTETLARQHLRTLEHYLRNASTKVVPLFGGQKPAERAAILEQIRTGEAQIVVGTQALVCNEIEFARLGLVVVDEQHILNGKTAQNPGRTVRATAEVEIRGQRPVVTEGCRHGDRRLSPVYVIIHGNLRGLRIGGRDVQSFGSRPDERRRTAHVVEKRSMELNSAIQRVDMCHIGRAAEPR
jgi:hypothetical protein